MTGFGLSESFDKTSNISIEIRGVNHRFLELSIKSNNLGNDLEDFIREAISKNINRGKIEVKIKAKSSSKTKYDINKKLLRMLESSLKEALGNRVDLNFSDIKDVSGIFNIETSQSINKKLIKNNFNTALKEFINSRFKEGKKIEKVLKMKIQNNKKNGKVLSPGMMKKHYSPGIPVLINQKKYDGNSAFIYLGNRYKNKKNFFSLSKNCNLNIAASNLYKVFRIIKRKGYKKIQISKIPNSGIGVAINDRIEKAANF